MSVIHRHYPHRIRLSIGVSGHRVPPKLPTEAEPQLRALLDRIFAAIGDAVSKVESDRAAALPAGGSADLASELVIVSSLAEGADRLVAQAGVAAGFALEVVLPLARAEYTRDFVTQASRAEFDYLLGRAAAIVELDGAPDERPRAYEAAGLFMLSRIDLLIALWDGLEAAGVGGTAQIVSRAIADGIFVVWIEPTNPNVIKVSRCAADGERSANVNARPKESFRSADVATVARVAKKIVTLPTQ